MHLVKLIFGAIAILSLNATAVPTNITVDDSDLSLVYSAGWNDQSCSVCNSKPDATYNKTWHDGNPSRANGARLTVTLTFEGTAAYIYGIRSGDTIWPNFTDVTIYLDGAFYAGFQYGIYDLEIQQTHVYAYNVSIYEIQSLANQPHNLTMALTGASFVLLDYFIYTTDTTSSTTATMSTLSTTSITSSPLASNGAPSSSTSPPRNNKSILGPALGGGVAIAVVIVACALLLWCLIMRRNRASKPTNAPASENPAEFT